MAKPPASPVFNQTCTASGKPPRVTLTGAWYQTLLQNSASSAMVRRVLSLWGMITRAAPAMGALAYGVSAEFLGLQLPVLAGCLLCALAWLRTQARVPRIAPILERGGTLA
jgi:hypothetical protein